MSLKFKIFGLVALVFMGCTPDEYESLNDNSIIDVNDITNISIIPNHYMLIADGKAEIDLRPYLYYDHGGSVPEYRVTDDMIEYFTDEGKELTRYFSTDDQSMVGKTVSVTMYLKETDKISEPITFEIIEPIEELEEIVIPVVFHIVQTSDDINIYSGKYSSEFITNTIAQLNRIFAGEVSTYATGVNSSITFKAATYDPDGDKLSEEGINRVVVETIVDDDAGIDVYDFIEDNDLIWSAENYMNIWLISDMNGDISNFSSSVVYNCRPAYYDPLVDVADIPEGLSLSEYTTESSFALANSGLVYKLQELVSTDNNSWDFCDIVYYVGVYLGLSPTYQYSYNGTTVLDYCDDTIDYDSYYNVAGTCTVDSTYVFKSVNIMDDVNGVHSAISKEQALRARWVLNNVPERYAWKSNFAFTGE